MVLCTGGLQENILELNALQNLIEVKLSTSLSSHFNNFSRESSATSAPCLVPHPT